MSSSLIALLKSERLTGENYTTWKSNLNTILVVDDLRFVLTEECPHIPARNAPQTVKDAYDRWTKANDKAKVYILASLSEVLAKKHEGMVSVKGIESRSGSDVNRVFLRYVTSILSRTSKLRLSI